MCGCGYVYGNVICVVRGEERGGGGCGLDRPNDCPLPVAASGLQVFGEHVAFLEYGF